jgi:hypothetical protein
MHNVFPKAKFRDCIEMTLRAGDQSKLRVKRREWIDLTKPKIVDVEDGRNADEDGLEALRSAEREETGFVFTRL